MSPRGGSTETPRGLAFVPTSASFDAIPLGIPQVLTFHVDQRSRLTHASGVCPVARLNPNLNPPVTASGGSGSSSTAVSIADYVARAVIDSSVIIISWRTDN